MPIISRSGYNTALPKYNHFLEDNYQRRPPKLEKKKLKRESSNEKKRTSKKYKRNRENYTWDEQKGSYVSANYKEESDWEDQDLSHSNDQIKLIFDNDLSDTFGIPDCESSIKDVCGKCHKPIRPPILQQSQDDEEEESHSELFRPATSSHETDIPTKGPNNARESNDRNSGIQTSSLLRLFTDKLSTVASHFGVDGALMIHKQRQKQAQCGVSFDNERHSKCECQNFKCQPVDIEDSVYYGQDGVSSSILCNEDVITKEISSNTTIESRNRSRADFQSQTSFTRIFPCSLINNERVKDAPFKEDYYSKSSVSFDPAISSQQTSSCKNTVKNVDTYTPPKFDKESLYYKDDKRRAFEDCDEDDYVENATTKQKQGKNKYNNDNNNSESDQSISQNSDKRSSKSKKRKTIKRCSSTGRTKKKRSQCQNNNKNKKDEANSGPKSRDECTNEIISGNYKARTTNDHDKTLSQSPQETTTCCKEDYYYKTVPFKEKLKLCMPKFSSSYKRCKKRNDRSSKGETKTVTVMTRDSPMEWRSLNEDEASSKQGKPRKSRDYESDYQECSNSNSKRKMKKVTKKISKESVSSSRSGSCTRWRR